MKKLILLAAICGAIFLQLRTQVVIGIPVQPAEMKQYYFLKNGDFETGTNRTISGWKIEGKAFRLITGMYFQNTWENQEIVPEATIGGDYWKDIKFHIGYKHQKWITSMGDGTIDNPNSATGNFTSDPFKLYLNNNFISFLISGGKDIENLKIELLEYSIRPRISGNITAVGNPATPTIPGSTPGNNVRTVYDTLLVNIPGILPKTGHNNDIFRRDGWYVERLDTAKFFVLRITDNAGSPTNKWGHINIDDVRMGINKNIWSYINATDSSRIQAIWVKDFVTNSSQNILADYYVPIYGAADMHTHLMSHLAMGNKLLHGAPDSGSLLPPGTVYKDAGFDVGETTPDCNSGPLRASSVAEALGSCNATHGGWGTDNNCGNYLRAAILNYAFDKDYIYRFPPEVNPHGDHPHAGFPNFIHWPNYSSVSHQQMYVDWIRRAYEGGLRILVTLTVNSELMGGILSGDGPMDDKSTADLQLDEIRNFVFRHNDFMELALDAKDMRRIIRSNKMAVIIGMEVDNIGNFNYANVPANETTVRTEIQRLFDKGVRYIFPIHLVNNKFGGSAIYSTLFNISNKFANSRPLPWGTPIPPGLMFNVKKARDPNITYSLKLVDNAPPGSMNAIMAGMRGFFEGISQIPYPPATNMEPGSRFCFPGRLGCIDQFKIISSLLTPDPSWDIYNSITGGQQNQLGLTTLGDFAIKEMMKLGMIIDVDHMSDSAVTNTLQIANRFGYPVASGHNGMRDGGASENQRSDEQLSNIRALGGVFGLGISGQTSGEHLSYFRSALRKMSGGAVTIGSDINGFAITLRPRFTTTGKDGNRVIYRTPAHAGLAQYTFYNKTWDYNTEGLAHIGLYPDFYQDLKNVGMTQSERQVFFSAADYFVQMWEKCESQKLTIR
jgi:microsomal dipeptidase-like Zn-dependent dipeptidase